MRIRSIPTVAAVVTMIALVTACGDDGPLPPIQAAEASDNWSAGRRQWSQAFDIEPWTRDAFEATDMRFLPDGRALLITKGGWSGAGTGKVVLVSADGQTSRELLEVPVCSDAERGLLGLELSPSFADDQTFYLFYTRQMSECGVATGETMDDPPQPVFNRVSSFTFDEAGIDPASETVILDELPGHVSAHNAGGMAWLPDGTMLVAVGEAGYRRSRDLDFIAGKILRLNPDRPGEGAPDNPYFDSANPGSVRSLVYASGLRNPFRVTVDPETAAVVATDVGTDEFEEVNLIQPGGDYGFPDVEGPATLEGVTPPALWYKHEEGCNSVIGGAWVPPGWVPNTTDRQFAFSDFGCGGVFVGGLDGNKISTVSVVAPLLERAVSSLVFGPDNALYAVAVGPGPFQVLRISPRIQ